MHQESLTQREFNLWVVRTLLTAVGCLLAHYCFVLWRNSPSRGGQTRLRSVSPPSPLQGSRGSGRSKQHAGTKVHRRGAGTAARDGAKSRGQTGGTQVALEVQKLLEAFSTASSSGPPSEADVDSPRLSSQLSEHAGACADSSPDRLCILQDVRPDKVQASVKEAVAALAKDDLLGINIWDVISKGNRLRLMTCLCLKEDGERKAVGIAIYKHVAQELQVLYLGVAPAERRRGVGSSLVRTLREIAKREPFCLSLVALLADSSDGGKASLPFWRTAGFRFVDVKGLLRGQVYLQMDIRKLGKKQKKQRALEGSNPSHSLLSWADIMVQAKQIVGLARVPAPDLQLPGIPAEGVGSGERPLEDSERNIDSDGKEEVLAKPIGHEKIQPVATEQSALEDEGIPSEEVGGGERPMDDSERNIDFDGKEEVPAKLVGHQTMQPVAIEQCASEDEGNSAAAHGAGATTAAASHGAPAGAARQGRDHPPKVQDAGASRESQLPEAADEQDYQDDVAPDEENEEDDEDHEKQMQALEDLEQQIEAMERSLEDRTSADDDSRNEMPARGGRWVAKVSHPPDDEEQTGQKGLVAAHDNTLNVARRKPLLKAGAGGWRPTLRHVAPPELLQPRSSKPDPEVMLDW